MGIEMYSQKSIFPRNLFLVLCMAEVLYIINAVAGTLEQLSSAKFDARTHRNYFLLPDTTECGVSWLNDPQYIQSHRRTRSINGRPTPLGKYLSVVRIFAKDETAGIEYARCTGTLISSRYVLTAAHCSQKLGPGEYLTLVKLGVHDQTRYSECGPYGKGCAVPINREIEEVTIHDGYSSAIHSDIALIRLSKDVPFTNFVKPICLPYHDSLFENWLDQKVAGVGWGRLNAYYDTVPVYPRMLTEVTLVLSPREMCDRFSSNNRGKLTELEVCALGANGMGPCFGDSGGPLIKTIEVDIGDQDGNRTKQWRQFQIGITAKFASIIGNLNCGRYNVPSIYVNVIKYMPWILDNLRP